ncbi:MAG TPA: tetratricopeptide repeat protein [Oculatellaceae cyanobacterium]
MAFSLSLLVIVVGAKCSLPVCAGDTSPAKPSPSLSAKAPVVSQGTAPEEPNDPYKSDVRKARLFIRNRHELEARAILKAVCSHPNASNESRMMYAETFLDFEGAEDSSPGAREAFDGLKTVIQKDPKNWRAYRDLASVANMRGKYSDAVQLATKAIAVGGNNMATYRQRMLAYTHLQRSDEALKDMAVMLSMQPTTVNYMLQGDTLRGLKRYKEAAASYRNGLAMGGFQYKDRCFNQLFTCLKLAGDYTGAIAEVDKRLKAEPDNPEWNDDKGQCQMKLKMFADAVKSFSVAIKAYPIEAYYLHRAQAYEQLGEKALAEADRAKGKAVKKDEPPLF